MKHYDAIVIGAGQAGTPLAKKLAGSGLKTALIEKRWLGGTCVNDGCSPTKTMLASAKAAWSVGHHKSLGVDSGPAKIDYKAILKRKNDVVHRMRRNLEKGVAETGNLDLIEGEARFTGKKQITVSLKNGGSQVLSADQLFINAGERPSIPDIEGIEDIAYLTSTTIMELDYVPEHLLVLGSGYVGMEFGQMFKRFGSKVTILEPSERILKKEDQDIAEEISAILRAEGIAIQTGTTAIAFEKKTGHISVTLRKKGKTSKLTCSHVLIATGRIPQSDALKLDAAGIGTDEKGYIVVNDQLETTAKDIYAMGDIKGGPAFTHISYDDYRVIAENVIGKKKATIKDRIVPYCMFIDPQLGRVGITEQEAREQGIDIKVAVIKNDSVARSIETGDIRGMMKAVVDAQTGKILGASVLAEQGGEVVTVLQVAMMGGLSYEQIMNGAFAHPTYSESLNNLFMTLEQ
jgi:pyruvate/2-oxoglutarate dehydrogenase complex dihydrolipoamide dehydrogenase (E3) component